jgi:GH24 family phage-related lysozyme (muramidase)
MFGHMLQDPEIRAKIEQELIANLRSDPVLMDYYESKNYKPEIMAYNLLESLAEGKVHLRVIAYSDMEKTALYNALFNSKIWKTQEGEELNLFEYLSFMEYSEYAYFGKVEHEPIPIRIVGHQEFERSYLGVALSGLQEGTLEYETAKAKTLEHLKVTPAVIFSTEGRTIEILIDSSKNPFIGDLLFSYLHEVGHHLFGEMKRKDSIKEPSGKNNAFKTVNEGLTEDFAYTTLARLADTYRDKADPSKDHGFDLLLMDYLYTRPLVPASVAYYKGSMLVKTIKESTTQEEFRSVWLPRLLRVQGDPKDTHDLTRDLVVQDGVVGVAEQPVIQQETLESKRLEEKQRILSKLRMLNIDGNPDIEFLAESISYLVTYSNHLEYERGVYRILKGIQPGNQKLQLAALLHDIGKTGPVDLPSNLRAPFTITLDEAHTAVTTLFGIEGTSLETHPKDTSIKDFLDLSEQQGKLTAQQRKAIEKGLVGIENPFTRQLLTLDDTMGDFFDSHTLWSVQQLKRANVNEDIIQWVSEHHRIDVYGDRSYVLFVDTEAETIERIPKREVPEPRVLPILDPEKAAEFVESEPDPDKKLAKQIMIDNLNHVTHEQFQDSLEEVADAFNKEIGQTPYALLYDTGPHKSRRWTYSLAERHIQNKPVSKAYAVEEGEQKNRRAQKIDENIREGIDTFVIFDDASYTGGQTSRSILGIIDRWQRINNDGSKPKIIVALPHVASEAIQRLSKITGAEITVLSSQGLRWNNQENNEVTGNILSGSEILDRLPIEPEQKQRIRSKHNHILKPLTYFDHRVPDYRSFPVEVANLIAAERELHTRRPYAYTDTSYYQEELLEATLFFTDEELLGKEKQLLDEGMDLGLRDLVEEYRALSNSDEITPEKIDNILKRINDELGNFNQEELTRTYSLTGIIIQLLYRGDISSFESQIKDLEELLDKTLAMLNSIKSNRLNLLREKLIQANQEKAQYERKKKMSEEGKLLFIADQKDAMAQKGGIERPQALEIIKKKVEASAIDSGQFELAFAEFEPEEQSAPTTSRAPTIAKVAMVAALFLSPFISSFFTSAVAATDTQVVASTTFNGRSGPGINNPRIASVSPGTYDIHQQSGKWANIDQNRNGVEDDTDPWIYTGGSKTRIIRKQTSTRNVLARPQSPLQSTIQNIDLSETKFDFQDFTKRLEEREGREPKMYPDGSGNPTIGVGHLLTANSRAIFRSLFRNQFDSDQAFNTWFNNVRQGNQALTDTQIDALAKYDIERHIDSAVDLFPNFKKYPYTLQAALLDGVYRGDHKASYKTTRLINEGKFNEAATEYLNRRDYQFEKRAREYQDAIATHGSNSKITADAYSKYKAAAKRYLGSDAPAFLKRKLKSKSKGINPGIIIRLEGNARDILKGAAEIESQKTNQAYNRHFQENPTRDKGCSPCSILQHRLDQLKQNAKIQEALAELKAHGDMQNQDFFHVATAILLIEQNNLLEAAERVTQARAELQQAEISEEERSELLTQLTNLRIALASSITGSQIVIGEHGQPIAVGEEGEWFLNRPVGDRTERPVYNTNEFKSRDTITWDEAKANIDQDRREAVKQLVKKSAEELTDNERDFILSLDADSLKGQLASSVYKKLVRLQKDLEEPVEDYTEYGPSISESEYETIDYKLQQFLDITDSALTGQRFRDIPMSFILQGSLITGWSDKHGIPSDHEHLSDMDILLVVEDDYWDQIPEIFKLVGDVPRTDEIAVGNVYKFDTGLAELMDMLTEIKIASKIGRPIKFIIMPESSYPHHMLRREKMLYQNKLDITNTFEERQTAFTEEEP